MKALSQVFRGKFLAGLVRAGDCNAIRFGGSTAALAEPRERARFVNGLRAKSWVVYAKQPFAGPAQVLDYLGRYTHSVALDQPPPSAPASSESVEDFWLRVAALDIHRCAHCKVGRMRVIAPISAAARAPLPRPP